MWLKWLPWRFLVRRLTRSSGFLDPMAVWSRLHRFAQPSEVAEPVELLRAGAVFHARGLMNARAVQHNLDWVWPYWVERLFRDALERPAEDRGSFLEEACGDDTALRDEVASLLAHHDQSSGVLEHPPIDAAAREEILAIGARRVGTRIGRVGSADLLELLDRWGEADPADPDGSGTVDAGDLLVLLAAWGPCP